jgi:probable ATP-dependent RNA helicase DDX4
MSISGENAPAPVQSFEDAGLRTLLMENIKKSGYTKPTPIQRLSIPAAMLKRDMMNCAQTGSGKTAAFLVP